MKTQQPTPPISETGNKYLDTTNNKYKSLSHNAEDPYIETHNEPEKARELASPKV
jgi:hypothetical protein